MNDLVKQDIASILEELISIFKSKDSSDIIQIKILSDHTIHNASIFQDEDSISIAVLAYALGKILEIKFEKTNYNILYGNFQKALDELNQNRIDSYRRIISRTMLYISNLDAKLKIYIQEVINKAQIKKGTKIYEHGISLSRAASLLGISQWELMSYIGKTKISDYADDESVFVKSRIEFARGLFR